MLGLVDAAIAVAVTLALAMGAVALRALTVPAGAVATVFGAFIVVVGGYAFLALLVLFVFASSLATRYRFEEKARRKVQEGTHGERGISNVLAHILLPTALVGLGSLPAARLDPAEVAVLYTAALAFGAADTFASEFGVLSGRAVSLLTLRPVTAGTNGGVSAPGELFALAGALGTSILGYLLFTFLGGVTLGLGPAIAIGAGAGFLGCQIDSVLGELLENRGWLTKGSTNFLAMAGTIALAGLLLAAFGG